MDLHVEGHKDTSSGISVQGEVRQTPNEVEQHTKPLKINPENVLSALSYLRIDQSRVKPLDTGSSNTAAPRRGGYGFVIPAILDSDALADDRPALDDADFVAVKKLHYGTEDDAKHVLARFALEIKLLSDLSHQNVVELVGFVEEAEEGIAWMLFRWEKKGNLREFVRSAKWELPERVSLINDVTNGLAYLHERQPPICHGDLKSLNILVNEDNHAMITDFGSARATDSQPEEPTISLVRVIEEATEHSQVQQRNLERLTAEFLQSGNSLTMTGPAWTMRWAAPELLLCEGASPSLASDIWALGWIFWEGITGNFPFEDENKDIAVVLRITSGELPALDTDARLKQIKALCSLMMDCWSLEPNGRPSARACFRTLSFMSQSVPSNDPGSRSSSLLLALGRVHFQNSHYHHAAEYFREAKGAAESTGDQGGVAQCFEHLGDVYRLRNGLSEAENAYKQALDIFSQIGNERGIAQCVRSLGEIYRIRHEYSEAEEAYIVARDVFSKIGDSLGVARCIQCLGNVYQMRSEYAEAEEAYSTARNAFSQIGDRLNVAQCIRSQGEIYRMRHEVSEAEEAFTQSRDIFSQIGSQLGVAHCVRGLGNVYRMRNKLSEAEEAFIKAGDILARIDDRMGFAQCVQSLGELGQERNEISEAEKAFTMARDVFSQIGEQLGVAQCVQSLGDVYRLRDEYPEAEEAYLKARDGFSQIGNQVGFAECLLCLGDVYRMQNDYAQAEDAYIRARDVSSEAGDHRGLVNATVELAEVHRSREEYSTANDLLTEAREISFTLNDHDLLSWVDRRLASLPVQ